MHFRNPSPKELSEITGISEEDINALRNGNVIYIFVNEEYGMFIALRKD